MKMLTASAALVLLIITTGCGGGSGDSGLLGRLPQGYDAYITVDPERAGVDEILEIVKDNLPDYELADIEEEDFPIDVFNWDEWKEELGIEPGEIGFIGLSEDMDFLAVFLPCGDGEKLREFVEDAGGEDETEFLQMDEYTVMVIAWNDDDQIDDLEEALEGQSLSSDEKFIEMFDKASVGDAAMSFVFFEEITEMPVMAFIAANDNSTELSVAVIIEDAELEEYSGMFGEGLQSSSIMFPENTMAATRTTIDIDGLLDLYDEMMEGNRGNSQDIDTGLALMGFDSAEEFIGIFKGDFCVAVSEIELDGYGEPEGGAGVFAMSLSESEKLESSLDMISAMVEAYRESFGDVTAYRIDIEGEDLWFFISEDVFYVSFNIDPDDVTEGIKASDFFTGSSTDGFIGGAANPEMVMNGLSLDRDTEELIQDVFAENADFSISFDGTLAYSRVTAGPDAITALVSIGMQMQ